MSWLELFLNWMKPKPVTTPAMPSAVSPMVLSTLDRQRKGLANMKGRKSTLLTGGLAGNPALMKGGLFPI